jgi:hypothetical protein
MMTCERDLRVSAVVICSHAIHRVRDVGSTVCSTHCISVRYSVHFQ